MDANAFEFNRPDPQNIPGNKPNALLPLFPLISIYLSLPYLSLSLRSFTQICIPLHNMLPDMCVTVLMYSRVSTFYTI